MSKLQRLQDCSTLGDLAHLLGYKPKAAGFLIYKQQDSVKYHSFEVPKKSGGFRSINAPHARLKKLQRRLSAYLQDCIDEIDKTNGYVSTQSHGFVRTRSIMTNASMHRGRRYVLNCDIENFFGSINFGRIRGALMADKSFALNQTVATVIAQVGCYEKALPQGAPTSPVLSNIVARSLDSRLSKLAKRLGCTYTRYADDLTFSTNSPSFPSRLAVTCDSVASGAVIGKDLLKEIVSAGFKPNAEKTRLQFKDSRQDVTGLVVNRHVSVKAPYRRLARAMVHRLIHSGSFHAAPQTDSTDKKDEPGSLPALRGMLGFIDSVSNHRTKSQHSQIVDKEARKSDSRRLSAEGLIYQTFLFYDYFYASASPRILCEGKTDGIYIKYAIRRLLKNFPNLGYISANKDFHLKVDLHRYTDTNRRILHLGGGTAQLSQFIRHYDSMWKKNTASVPHAPCIVVVDNDSGANCVRSAASDVSKTKISSSTPYARLIHNLFLVQTPLINQKDSCIEDFFDEKTLIRKLGSKSFHYASSGFDPAKHYGKSLFAEQIVAKKWESIDFDGFSELLNRISSCITDYSKIKVK